MQQKVKQTIKTKQNASDRNFTQNKSANSILMTLQKNRDLSSVDK